VFAAEGNPCASALPAWREKYSCHSITARLCQRSPCLNKRLARRPSPLFFPSIAHRIRSNCSTASVFNGRLSISQPWPLMSKEHHSKTRLPFREWQRSLMSNSFPPHSFLSTSPPALFDLTNQNTTLRHVYRPFATVSVLWNFEPCANKFTSGMAGLPVEAMVAGYLGRVIFFKAASSQDGKISRLRLASTAALGPCSSMAACLRNWSDWISILLNVRRVLPERGALSVANPSERGRCGATPPFTGSVVQCRKYKHETRPTLPVFLWSSFDKVMLPETTSSGLKFQYFLGPAFTVTLDCQAETRKPLKHLPPARRTSGVVLATRELAGSGLVLHHIPPRHAKSCGRSASWSRRVPDDSGLQQRRTRTRVSYQMLN
jgi:hypothetical protein